jgi:hypothetical protein
MRGLTIVVALALACAVTAGEVESRRLTHYLPQDTLEAVVRAEKWTELTLNVKGGLCKGDVVRVWAGGLIDRGGDQPGENVNGPEGTPPAAGGEARPFALSDRPEHAHALLLKTESTVSTKCLPAGKPLELKLTKDGEKVWIGFNDEKGRFQDNHLGRGKRHQLDPLWVRIEVVRIIVD